jgi:hypothetical protein
MALLLVFSFSLAWAWTALALVLRTPGAVSNVSLLLVFPLTFASNVFVDPHTMPGWLRTFVDANPVSRLVTAERRLMDGSATAARSAGCYSPRRHSSSSSHRSPCACTATNNEPATPRRTRLHPVRTSAEPFDLE